MYIWERPDWPSFTWDAARLLQPLAIARQKQGYLLGSMAQLGFDLKAHAQLEATAEEAIGSSAIEGENLDREAVRSSVARRLRIDSVPGKRRDRRADGIVEFLLDATEHYEAPLTVERLFRWHTALFSGDVEQRPKRVGQWRDDSDGPMQVISGPVGRQRVHFEAPAAERLDKEITPFLKWFNNANETDGLLRAAIAHLWFVTIHPFEDGNGRIARAIADQALAQSENSAQRFYSMSRQINRERSDYYAALEKAQKGTLDITDWLLWFLGCFTRAVEGAESIYGHVLRKANFWQLHRDAPVSERQRLVLNRYLDGFEGKLTAKKWAALCKVSIPTAQRDINDLLAHGLLRRNPGGSKNISYEVVEG